MRAERKKWIGNILVEEYYRNRKMIVYVDHKKATRTFEEVCEGVQEALDHEYEQSTLHG